MRLRFKFPYVLFPWMDNPICSRTMKVHHLIAFLAVMLLGVAYGADVKYEATFTGVT